MEIPLLKDLIFKKTNRNETDWYKLSLPEQIDSPALLIYPDRVQHNINEIIHLVGNPKRLMPHVKTIKMSAIVKMQMNAGIRRFKCATIAEAEMLGDTKVNTTLVAYQLNEPKAKRLIQLIKKYPETYFSSLIDNLESARMINQLFKEQNLIADTYIDIDNGMHRTGFPVEKDFASFYKKISEFSNLKVKGIHVYDGNIEEKDFQVRKEVCKRAFEPVEKIVTFLKEIGDKDAETIAGGSPTFPFHSANRDVICSPGTTLLWDDGYKNNFPELPFLKAAVLLTRIVSIYGPNQITTDLGHKSVAAENPIDKRITFLNLNGYSVLSQTEEHLVVHIGANKHLVVGTVLYGTPYHICPTVALYDEVQVINNGGYLGQWAVEARRKRISI